MVIGLGVLLYKEGRYHYYILQTSLKEIQIPVVLHISYFKDNCLGNMAIFAAPPVLTTYVKLKSRMTRFVKKKNQLTDVNETQHKYL